MLSEGLSVSSYDIAEEEDFVLSDSEQPNPSEVCCDNYFYHTERV